MAPGRDKVAGHLLVGANEQGEVVINFDAAALDPDGCGHIVFSVRQARALARILHRQAREAQLRTEASLDRLTGKVDEIDRRGGK